MTLSQRINALAALGTWVESPDDLLQAAMHRSTLQNPWFTPENITSALQAISSRYLSKEALLEWTAPYEIPDAPAQKTIGLVLAGNIPLVGFHDVLSVFIAGHRALIKLSDKDSHLLPTLLQWMVTHYPATHAYFSFCEQLKGFDAVIATGSNNSARYFEAYFGKYPHIIRKNRNSVAVLTGRESDDALLALGEDVFSYFGMGCRNVSKLYVPQGYDFQALLSCWETYSHLLHHDKYKNNFDYNYALALLNRQAHITNGIVLITESESLHSRIAGLHMGYYTELGELAKELSRKKEEIQCIVAATELPGLRVLPFGTSQSPGMSDYADDVDTMAFLSSLRSPGRNPVQ